MLKGYKKHRSVDRAALSLIMAIIMGILCACGSKKPDEQIDLSDPSGAQGITTAAQLLHVIEEGETDTLTLNASIDLEGEMIKLDTPGAALTINGNGFTISGSGDCIIRLANNCTLNLSEVTLNAGSNAIGCLGDSAITGSATIKAVANAVYAKGHVTVGESSRLYVVSNVGSGIDAQGLELEKDARVLAQGALGGVNITKDDIMLNADSVLDSNTDENYNALKCEGTLIMLDGSKLIVKNNGEYHGAEISELYVEGVVSIEAQGGDKGVGLFLFRVDEAINVVGFCEPELRFEIGNGSVSFFESASEFPTPTPEATETPDQTPEG
jgi:hypothetical protein